MTRCCVLTAKSCWLITCGVCHVYLFGFCFFQTLSFYFPPCGKIPPPVIMVQNVSFKYSDNTVSRNAAPPCMHLDEQGKKKRTDIWLVSAAAHLQKPGVRHRLGHPGGSGGAQRSGQIHVTQAAYGGGQFSGGQRFSAPA